MSTRDLKAKYGKSLNTTSAINRAIRAELVAGDKVVEALAQARIDGADEVFAALGPIVDCMAEEIRRRYGMPPRDANETAADER